MIKLFDTAERLLEFGGSVTIHLVEAGGSVLRMAPAAFDEWQSLARQIAAHGNAVLIAFLRSSPAVFGRLSNPRPGKVNESIDGGSIARILSLIAKLADKDAESVVGGISREPEALEKVSLDQFEEWIQRGIEETIEWLAEIAPQLLCT